MTTYSDSGVNIELGDESSRLAYKAAMETFASRSGMIGEPVKDEGGFAGLLDMGDFYLVQNDDGVGTKIQIAESIGKYDTLGYDLVAMVADDAICIGAEPISITNTLDVDKVDPQKIGALMNGLKDAATKHKIVVPGGEIAELGSAVSGYLWNATAVGVVEKDKLITGKNIQAGDQIIALHSVGFRSNGISLVRHILKNHFGPDWAHQKYDDTRTWGEVTLTPSLIYTSAILELHGRFRQPKIADLKGIAHITGGGIEGNLSRVMKKTQFRANLDRLPTPHEPMLRLMEMGQVSEEEAKKTWNMGVGMIVISNDVDQISTVCQKHGIQTSVIGQIES